MNVGPPTLVSLAVAQLLRDVPGGRPPPPAVCVALEAVDLGEEIIGHPPTQRTLLGALSPLAHGQLLPLGRVVAPEIDPPLARRAARCAAVGFDADLDELANTGAQLAARLRRRTAPGFPAAWGRAVAARLDVFRDDIAREQVRCLLWAHLGLSTWGAPSTATFLENYLEFAAEMSPPASGSRWSAADVERMSLATFNTARQQLFVSIRPRVLALEGWVREVSTQAHRPLAEGLVRYGAEFAKILADLERLGTRQAAGRIESIRTGTDPAGRIWMAYAGFTSAMVSTPRAGGNEARGLYSLQALAGRLEVGAVASTSAAWSSVCSMLRSQMQVHLGSTLTHAAEAFRQHAVLLATQAVELHRLHLGLRRALLHSARLRPLAEIYVGSSSHRTLVEGLDRLSRSLKSDAEMLLRSWSRCQDARNLFDRTTLSGSSREVHRQEPPPSGEGHGPFVGERPSLASPGRVGPPAPCRSRCGDVFGGLGRRSTGLDDNRSPVMSASTLEESSSAGGNE